MNWTVILLIAGMVGLVVFQLYAARPGLPLDEAKAAVKAGTAILVDVRESGEWASGVAQQAALMPFSDLRSTRNVWRPFLEKNQGKRLLLYCASGTRSAMAAKKLRSEGVDALNAGSLSAWSKADWPVCPPKAR